MPTRRFDKIELSSAEFKELGYALIDRIADHQQNIRNKKITAGTTREALQELIRTLEIAPEEGQAPGPLLANTAQLLFEHSLFNGHPKFMAYITSSPAPLGILGDLLASAVNANVGAWILAPVATEIEKRAVQWVADFMGFPGRGGVMVSGGNMANHVCFLAAMRAQIDVDIRAKGVRGLDRQPVLYCSDQTHTWVQKSADLCGLGTDHIRWIDTDEQGRVDIALLEETIRKDFQNDYHPFLVVGTGGSVSTGVVDPLQDLATICEKYGLWFHIDGAYGALAAALPELADQFAGHGQADSIAVDPHKWLYAPLEAACALVKDPVHLTDTFSYRPPYYNFENSEMNYVDYGPQNSRGFRALKVWLSCRHLGTGGYRQLIREDIALAQYAFDLFDRLEDFEAFTQHLSITTFRYLLPIEKGTVSAADANQQLNQLNKAILNRMELEGTYFLSTAVIGDTFALRLCIVNFRTTKADLDALPEYIRQLAPRSR